MGIKALRDNPFTKVGPLAGGKYFCELPDSQSLNVLFSLKANDTLSVPINSANYYSRRIISLSSCQVALAFFIVSRSSGVRLVRSSGHVGLFATHSFKQGAQ